METMAVYIMRILKTRPNVVLSWGAHSFRSLDNDRGISFLVNGFLYQGRVLITYNEGADLFDVKIGDETHTGIYFDQLIDFIDGKVEKEHGQDYDKTVNDWLNSNAFKESFDDEE